MAEWVGGAFLSATLQVAFDRLASSDILDYFRGRKLKDGLLKKLHITLISINQVLENAEEMQYRNPNVKQWLDELKDAVFKAEDLLDEIAAEASREKLEAEFQTTTSKVRGFFTSFVNPFDKEIETRIHEVLESLEFLAKQKDVLGLKEGCSAGSEVGEGRKVSKRLPISIIDESSICGRDGDKEKIIPILLSHDMNVNQPPVNVITITGIGGMGKTTLARLVYEDKKMKDEFQLRAWVCISEEFDVVRVTKAILGALDCSTKDSNDLYLHQLELKERLMGKKFFLVLDDVWNESCKCWETLQAPFNYGNQGSKILVTTRNKKVALVMHSTYIHHLKPLIEEDCWKLFTKHAFNNEYGGIDPNLVSVGEKIVKKCGGLPLAIKTLGSLLHTKVSCQEWVKILESDIWNLSEDDSDIIPSLRLSYHHLPSNLKRCFVYCSIFPKYYDVDKDVLIQLWMAEGLLHSLRKGQSMEEVGNDFFNDLESRSFFELSKKDGCRYTMHDLINDLAKSIAGEFTIRVEDDFAQDISSKARYFLDTSIDNDQIENFELISKCNQLRYFMPIYLSSWHRDHDKDKKVAHVLSHLKYLRVLSFSRYPCIKELPDNISHLRHLRYLNLSSTSIKRLPNSVCMLINLQTLNLRNCRNLTELPSDFHKLINLYYLDLRGTFLEKMPKYMGKLKLLRILTSFVVGKNEGTHLKELGKLNHLRGTLSILKLESTIDPMDAQEANMKNKKYLDELEFRWSKNSEDSQLERCILESLQPSSNLKKLTIDRYNGTRFPNWFEASCLPNLVSLELKGSEYCLCLPPLGLLPSLKNLRIYGFNAIEVIGPEFYGNSSSDVPFISLENLEIRSMKQWEEWNICSEGESFQCLQKLSLSHCPKLRKTLPQHLPSLKQLQIENCESLEASLPKNSPVNELNLGYCKMISLEHVPNSLTKVHIRGVGVNESSLNCILHAIPSLELLELSYCDELVSTSIGGIGFSASNLNSISFMQMRNLKSLPKNMHALFPSLHSMILRSCPELESLPCGGLPPSLVHLQISRCPKFVASRMDWGLQNLHSLQRFHFSDNLENVESFPEEGLLPPNLKSLALVGCLNLTSINYKGLLHLQSLESICFVDCPSVSLQGLPDKGLPKSLSCLYIEGCCPLLKQRCQKDKGPDWPKISHIPRLRIFD